MPRSMSEAAIDHEQRQAEAESARARDEQRRIEERAQAERTRQHFYDCQAQEKREQRERERLAALTPVAELASEERDVAVAHFEREVTARKWDTGMARLVILPSLQRRGDGELFVVFQHFGDGKVITATMPLADAGVLLDHKTSPTLRIAEERTAWEQAQAAHRAEVERERAHAERIRRLYERRAAELARLQSTPPAHRAALLVAHELRASQPKLSAAFTRLAQHLAEDDTAALKRFVNETITDAGDRQVST